MPGVYDYTDGLGHTRQIKVIQNELASYDFTDSDDSWQFAGEISPFDTPLTTWQGVHLGLNTQGSTNCFSFFSSPEVQIENWKLYRARWAVGSSVTDPDLAVQLFLRINQRSDWAAWDRIVNSFLMNDPSVGNNKVYDVFFNPKVTRTADNKVLFSFDFLNLDWNDDSNSWLYLEELTAQVVNEAKDLTIHKAGTEIVNYDFTTGSEGWGL